MTSRDLMDIHRKLSKHYGSLHWWPAETPFEVCVGAILTQNTSWTNVEKAIANLKRECVLDCHCLSVIKEEHLAELIRPSGYFNEKAKKLKAFSSFCMEEFGGHWESARIMETSLLRRKLMNIRGLGPETVDSILLYALNKPVFVVDAYTKRIFSRHGFFKEDATYAQVQSFFESRIKPDRAIYNEFHAQIVNWAKDFCKKTKPECLECPVPCAWGKTASEDRRAS